MRVLLSPRVWPAGAHRLARHLSWPPTGWARCQCGATCRSPGSCRARTDTRGRGEVEYRVITAELVRCITIRCPVVLPTFVVDEVAEPVRAARGDDDLGDVAVVIERHRVGRWRPVVELANEADLVADHNGLQTERRTHRANPRRTGHDHRLPTNRGPIASSQCSEERRTDRGVTRGASQACSAISRARCSTHAEITPVVLTARRDFRPGRRRPDEPPPINRHRRARARRRSQAVPASGRCRTERTYRTTTPNHRRRLGRSRSERHVIAPATIQHEEVADASSAGQPDTYGPLEVAPYRAIGRFKPRRTTQVHHA